MTSPSPNDTPKKATEKKDAIELLKADHREVDQLFQQFESAKGDQRKKLVEKIGAALTAHTIIEEEIFYPACREKGVKHGDLDEAQVEHDTVKLLVADLLNSSQGDDYFAAKVTVLSEYVTHHVREEEDPSEGLFARAKSAGLDMDQLGQKLQARKDELMSDEKRLLSRPQKIRSLNLSHLTEEYGDMSRYPTDRYRDEEHRHEQRGREYRGVDYDDEHRGSSLSRGSRGEFYRGDYDEDFGPNRGAYGESDYDRSARGYPEDNRSGGRRIEQSGSGGRYRLDYERDDRYPRPDSDHEYYQRTRYGQGQGRDDRQQGYSQQGYGQNRDDRYYSGQSHGLTRGGDFGGRDAYGSGDDYQGDYEGRQAGSDRGRSDYGTGDYRRRSGSSDTNRGGRYQGSSNGFRGNR